MDNQKKLKTDEIIENVANIHESPILKLNDDCVRYILSFLPMKQRIRLQQVCKTWQRISKLPWSDIKKLDLSSPRFLDKPDPNKFKYDLPILKQVLSLCGSSLTHIILPDFHLTASSDLLILVKKMCPSLRSLHFNDTMITRKTAEIVAENFSDLNEITFGSCWPKCEDSLAQFFTNNKRLKTIDIRGNDRITGICLLGLPESLTKIVIHLGDSIQPEYVCNAFTKLINLRNITITYSTKLLYKFDSFIDALPNKLNIEELELMGGSSDRSDRLVHMKNIIHLTNLRKLVLEGNLLLHNETLTNVGTYCKNLKIAHFRDSNRVTNPGWQSFAATLDLEELKVSKLSQLPDKFFATMNMPSLTILKCYACHRFSAKTFRKLIPHLENLEKLEIYNCSYDYEYYDDKFLKNVVKSLKNRKNGKTLEMRILEEIDAVRKYPPLTLVKENIGVGYRQRRL